jgi:hypothetical protein
VGWVGFRDDHNGKVVLDWYSERTLEWCSDSPEDGKYADQGYLNSFPSFEGVKILTSPGFNLAPWNIPRHHITLSPKPTKTSVLVDGDNLTFFHFHGLRKVGKRFVTGEFVYGSRINSVLKKFVYAPYAEKLVTWDLILEQDFDEIITIKKRGTGFKGMISRMRKSAINLISITLGNSVKPANN